VGEGPGLRPVLPFFEKLIDPRSEDLLAGEQIVIQPGPHQGQFVMFSEERIRFSPPLVYISVYSWFPKIQGRKG
jgi:hypothetical protein